MKEKIKHVRTFVCGLDRKSIPAFVAGVVGGVVGMLVFWLLTGGLR